MSYQNSKLFTNEQKDMRMVIKAVIARQEASGWPVRPYLIACVNFDIDFIESYDSRIAEENKGAEIESMSFWENIQASVDQQKSL